MKACFTIFLLGCRMWISAQPGDGTSPPGLWLMQDKSSAEMPVFKIKPPDIAKLNIEDSLEEAQGMAPRFGIAFPVSITKENLVALPGNEGTYYFGKISAPGALSINLNFSVFTLGEGAKFWVSDPATGKFRGGFTAKNNIQPGAFAIAPLLTDELWIEYYEPAGSSGTWEISEAVYGYRSWSSSEKTGFGDAGACNVNVNCPIAGGWENQANATVMILTAGNTRKCTGTMINSVPSDGTPFLITANHCNTLANAIFMFNYQSPDCNNTDGPTDMVLSGCELLASNSNSDFHLLKLLQTPPPEYNAFYAGWNRLDNPASMAHCIHHPRGDIKKFSVDSQAVVSSGYMNPGTGYWQVTDWDIGTTEAGSSGSPLFDTQQRFVGQLRGGLAACNNDLSDYFGKFADSWDFDPDSNQQVAFWLDPGHSNIASMNGAYYATAFYNRDIKISNVTGISALDCKPEKEFTIHFLSLGSDTVDSVQFTVTLDGNVEYYTWTGNLAFLQNNTFPLTLSGLSIGLHTLTITVNTVNGLNDEQASNNTIQLSFEIIEGNYFVLELETDHSPQHTTVEVRDTSGAVLYSFGGFLPDSLQIRSFCLDEGCYTFRINDSQGDGICCDNGEGHYRVISTTGYVVAEGGIFDFFDETDFCSPYFDVNQSLFYLYPNPATDYFTLLVHPDFFGKNIVLTLYDYQGQMVYESAIKGAISTSVTIGDLSAGVYVVKIFEAATRKTWTDKLLVIR